MRARDRKGASERERERERIEHCQQRQELLQLHKHRLRGSNCHSPVNGGEHYTKAIYSMWVSLYSSVAGKVFSVPIEGTKTKQTTEVDRKCGVNRHIQHTPLVRG